MQMRVAYVDPMTKSLAAKQDTKRKKKSSYINYFLTLLHYKHLDRQKKFKLVFKTVINRHLFFISYAFFLSQALLHARNGPARPFFILETPVFISFGQRRGDRLREKLFFSRHSPRVWRKQKRY